MTEISRRRGIHGSLAIVLALTLVVAAAIAATSIALLIGSRATIYEARQDALLEEFESSAADAADGITEPADPGLMGYTAQNFDGTALVMDLSTDRSYGPLPVSAVPADLTVDWSSAEGPLRYLRSTLDGQDVFFVGTVLPVADGGLSVAIVTAYSLEPERAQVSRLVATGFVIGGVAVFCALLVGFGFGAVVTRPLRRLQRMVQALGTGERPPAFRSNIREIDEVGSALHESSERLRASDAELRRREASSRRMVSDVAHELRTPVTALVAVSEILDELETATPEERTSALAVTRSGVHRLAVLVEDLLEKSRLDAGVARLVPASGEAAAVIDEALWLLSDGADVCVSCPPGIVLHTDLNRLTTIVSNLVANALRHGAPPVTVTVDDDEGRCSITVHDTGDGIPPAEADRIFEPFAMIDAGRSAARGSGLGLAIARENALLLGGDLVLEPSSTGARFTVTIPSRAPSVRD